MPIPEILEERDYKKRKKLVNKWWKHTREVRAMGEIGKFQSHYEFMKDLTRRSSQQIDFGLYWHRREHPTERWRVSWIEKTGELYAVFISKCFEGAFDLGCVVIGKFDRNELDSMHLLTVYDKQVLEDVFPDIKWDDIDKHVIREV